MSTAQTQGKRIEFEDRTLSHGQPPEKLVGLLPLARWIPQDVHSMLDYGSGLAAVTGAFTADDDDPAAMAASLALAGSVIGVSALTDYRLSIAKVIPIEVHEAIDYAWGIGAIAAPFVFGYWKKSPIAALTHVVAGASTILSSLFTDYRAFRRRDGKAKRSSTSKTAAG